jgi:hypothetical protein
VADDLRTLQARLFRFVTSPLPCAAPFDRAEVYRDGYSFRLLDVLRDDFPEVAALVGERFEALVAEYAGRHPPTHPSLRHFGRRFAAFVAEHPLSRRWPQLGELAALEWARVEVFDAPEIPLLTLSDLDAIDPAGWPDHVFALAPSVRILPKAVVFRRDHAPCHRAIGRREADALRRVQIGAPFAQVCAALAGDAGVDDAARTALTAIAQWTVDGLLAR